MAKFKRGDICILDQDGELGLREWDIVKVRIMAKVGGLFSNKYLVAPIEPINYPAMKDGYSMAIFVCDGDVLTKSSMDEKVVIRCSMKTPVFNENDIKTIQDAVDELQKIAPISQTALRLKAIEMKIRYTNHFNHIATGE